ncbi:hypothetical protein SLE2022_075600 [Rubroshorea leprosula]
MGNRIGKMGRCCGVTGEISRRHEWIVEDALYEDLGHSFCYIRPEPAPVRLSSSKVYSLNDSVSPPAGISKTVTFGVISGASVSANVSTAPSGVLTDYYPQSATFEGTDCFASLPLQPVPRSESGTLPRSGPIERGFMSGPIERGFLSGPLFSGTLEKEEEKLQRSLSQSSSDIADVKPLRKSLTLIKSFKRAISNKIKGFVSDNDDIDLCSTGSLNDDDNDLPGIDKNVDDGNFLVKSQNLQWAQGKAGEDRTHIVVSEEDGWAFVGIYDGFNGPDAPDHLVSNLYNAVHRELEGLLWKNYFESNVVLDSNKENCPLGNGVLDSKPTWKRNHGKNVKRWRWEWDKESNSGESVNHSDVLRALSEALRKTEEAYLAMVKENPELALMGSCVLVTVMKGDDVYLMNVGDSRAILARKAEAKALHPIEPFPNLTSLHLTTDHSTYTEEEVERIRKEHPDDDSAVVNDRVKGYLKVTRAFGAGFLKQPELNDAVLEMFRINYVGKSPYITCFPSLYHYKLSTKDRYLILSSDGLYQYFTNEEVVAEVEFFLASFPEGDPAQHLIEEVLFRAAKKAGIDFHELLDIQQGDRRQYHDDVSVIVISLEGRIWRSSV